MSDRTDPFICNGHAGPQPSPWLSVVRGEPTAAELAALLVVLGRRVAEPEPDQPVARSLWAAPAAMMPAPAVPGPGAWRASGLPR